MKKCSEFSRSLAKRVSALGGSLFAGGVSRRLRRAFAVGIRRRVVANRLPILFSIVLATALYNLLHERAVKEEFVRNVAVKVRGVPEKTRVGIEPSTVRVVFRGSRADMLGLDMSPPVVNVNYPGVGVGSTGVEVKLTPRSLPIGGMRGFGSVAVVRFEPEKVRVIEDEVASISFDIDPPRLDGTPYRGYRAEVADYSPKKATVTGGGRRLKGWDSLGFRLQLPPVSVEGRAGDFSREVEVLPPAGEDAMDVELPTMPVKVDVRIAPPRDNRTLDNIPVRLSLPQDFAFPASMEVEPKSVKMTLVGVEEQLREVGVADVAVYAEISQDAIPGEGTNAFEVALVSRIPQDKSIAEVNLTPPTVTITAIVLPPPPPIEPQPSPEVAPPEKEEP